MKKKIVFFATILLHIYERNITPKWPFYSVQNFKFNFLGLVVTEDNRVFVAGGNYVYHEYKLFNSLSNGSTSRSGAKQSSHRNQAKDSKLALLNNEKDYYNDGNLK